MTAAGATTTVPAAPALRVVDAVEVYDPHVRQY